MKRVIAEGIFGIVLVIAGFSIVTQYFNEGSDPRSILPAAALELIGIFFLLFGRWLYNSTLSKSGLHIINRDVGRTTQKIPTSVLKRNSELINQWRKTVKVRDMLKLLKISTQAKKSE